MYKYNICTYISCIQNTLYIYRKYIAYIQDTLYIYRKYTIYTEYIAYMQNTYTKHIYVHRIYVFYILHYI